MSYYISQIDAGVRSVHPRNGQFKLPPYWVADVIRPSRAVRAWLRAHGFAWCPRRREWWRAYSSATDLAIWLREGDGIV